MIAADGRTLSVMERNVVLRDAAGRPIGYQGVLVDVTALREAQHALRTERDHAHHLLEAAGTFVILLDPAGDVKLVNRRGAALLGWEPHALAGRDWFETCVPADDRERRRALFDHAMAAGVTYDERLAEVRIVRRDGAERWLTWHHTLLHDAGGAGPGLPASRLPRPPHARLRHRRHRAPRRRARHRRAGLPRPAHRPGQPRAAVRAPRAGGRPRPAHRRLGRASVPRPRRLQGRHRLARPRRRRRGPAARRRAPGPPPSRLRCP